MLTFHYRAVSVHAQHRPPIIRHGGVVEIAMMRLDRSYSVNIVTDCHRECSVHFGEILLVKRLFFIVLRSSLSLLSSLLISRQIFLRQS